MEKPISILIAGDLLPSEENFRLFEQGNTDSLFGEKICQLFADADYSILNLEGPLTDSTTALVKDGPCIKAPKSTVAGIRELGIDAVALANNHITDFGQEGYLDTIEALDKAGIRHVGAGANADRIEKALSVHLNGKRICFYNVSETFFNIPGQNRAGANLYDEYLVCNDIKSLKQGHDYLIVLYHGGAEHFPYPTPQTRRRFHRMAECGADFITAQHTHCIGCEEYFKGAYLLYGQGNFLFARQKQQQYLSLTKEGLVSELVIDETGLKVKNHLIQIDGPTLRYAPKQDFSGFIERGKHLDDEDFIISRFKEEKSKEIMEKCILSLKGDFPLRRFIVSLFPNAFTFDGLIRSYTRKQYNRNLYMFQGDRRQEDMYYVWQYMMEHKTTEKK